MMSDQVSISIVLNNPICRYAKIDQQIDIHVCEMYFEIEIDRCMDRGDIVPGTLDWWPSKRFPPNCR